MCKEKIEPNEILSKCEENKCEGCSSKNLQNKNLINWNEKNIQYMDLPLKNHYFFILADQIDISMVLMTWK